MDKIHNSKGTTGDTQTFTKQNFDRISWARKGPKKKTYQTHQLGFPSFGHTFGLQSINQSVVLTWAQQGAPIGTWYIFLQNVGNLIQ